MILNKKISFSPRHVSESMLYHRISDPSNVDHLTRSHSGINAGVVFVYNKQFEATVVKLIDKTIEAWTGEAIMKALELKTIPVEFMENISQQESIKKLLQHAIDSNGLVFPDRSQKQMLKNHLKSPEHRVVLMPRVNGQTLHEKLIFSSDEDRKSVLLDPKLLKYMGKGLFADKLSGNDDRFVFLNLGNIMLVENKCVFIDNEAEITPASADAFINLTHEKLDEIIENFFESIVRKYSRVGLNESELTYAKEAMKNGFISALRGLDTKLGDNIDEFIDKHLGFNHTDSIVYPENVRIRYPKERTIQQFRELLKISLQSLSRHDLNSRVAFSPINVDTPIPIENVKLGIKNLLAQLVKLTSVPSLDNALEVDEILKKLREKHIRIGSVNIYPALKKFDSNRETDPTKTSEYSQFKKLNKVATRTLVFLNSIPEGSEINTPTINQYISISQMAETPPPNA